MPCSPAGFALNSSMDANGKAQNVLALDLHLVRHDADRRDDGDHRLILRDPRAARCRRCAARRTAALRRVLPPLPTPSTTPSVKGISSSWRLLR